MTNNGLTQTKFTIPAAPDLAPVLALHRNHDGFVSFHRKVDGRFEDLFSVPARDLDGIFPQLSPMLEVDSYFSIHGFYRGGWGIARNSPAGLKLQRAERKKDSLRYLTACFVDLDCHQLGIDVGTAIGRVITAQDRGDIPPASLITRSGRGVWLFWFLTDADEDCGLVRAWPEKTRVWCNIQREIGSRLANLGSDSNARDASRVTRIAGSVNTKAKTETRVAYWLQSNQSGKKYTYHLPELSEFFNINIAPDHPAITQKRKEISSPAITQKRKGKKNLGQAARWLKAVRQFSQLWEHRGTFAAGTRNNAILVYASILRSQSIPPPAVRSEIERLFKSFAPPCYELQDKLKMNPRKGQPFTRQDREQVELGSNTRQDREQVELGRGSRSHAKTGNELESKGEHPFTRKDMEDALKSYAIYPFGRLKNQDIADLLKITVEESAALETWPAAKVFLPEQAQQTTQPKLTRPEAAKQRQAILKTYTDELGFCPSGDDLVEYLADLGISAVKSTVLLDLEKAEIKNPRKRPARKRKARKNEPKLFN